MDIGEDPPQEPRGNRPPGTREEADTEQTPIRYGLTVEGILNSPGSDDD
jgi:hypothetical protein